MLDPQLLEEVNEIRFVSGVPALQNDRRLQGHEPMEALQGVLGSLFDADALHITTERMVWIQLNVTDMEEDAVRQYDTVYLHVCETPEPIRNFLLSSLSQNL